MLIDTSGFLCLYVAAEAHHLKAIDLYDKADERLTTSYVLTEYTALAQARRVPRQEIIKFSTRILEDKEIEIIWIDEDLHRKAVDLIEQRSDKRYSMCDAASFVVMRERTISAALTTDRDFEQEGFLRLLK